ncbi:sodium:solute symporter [Alicyclobacillus cycloheptanicus]|uniref:SSS family solute:Na+ symporter n=1 Tax=Alicyclobacillus cycloheptanicus TaxID=1457 RepID=A0ABT9XI17_9BACL|nr:sodium:solute symporter [Alicyclobacillus cycloheptanicus]MDQ0189842.1 SSS family solute:Na+ symporter [Alicyclobacillus cycloheptanicus]WDM02473.1 sodium:solute symporter [Alicyclobacillus cycloheptanicus]
MNWTALVIFIIFFLLVTVLGFVAARWRKADLNHLEEWGLAGRKFGTLITWFLVGGDLYTAYTFIAVPALMYGAGALGFYAVPYTIIIYPIFFAILPRFWSVAKKHGYVTASDFIEGRFGDKTLALAIAVTGIVATMPYIALQLTGMQAVLAAMGLGGDWPLIIAFVILALYTYTSGLRAPAMIAVVKDLMIYITVIVAIIVIPMKLHGFGHIFSAASAALATHTPPGAPVATPSMYAPYATLALGSALALFLYPHSLTGILSSSSRRVIKRNMALLPAYSFALGIIALLGFMALAAGIVTKNTSAAVPLLFLKEFPSWFAGFGFAAIAIGALVPAAIMSIAASNLFTRNIYKAYFNKSASPQNEAKVAKFVSLIVKVGALVFILGFPQQYAISMQQVGGILVLQTLPAIIFGLYTRWFHRRALLLGWAVGILYGIYMWGTTGYKSTTYALHIFGQTWAGYAGIWALIVNVLVTVVFTLIFQAVKLGQGTDATSASDYSIEPSA